MKYFDQKNMRLVFIEKTANSYFWDEKWSNEFKNKLISSTKDRLLVNTTKRYLGTGSKILEGGCGLGGKVYCLHSHGYDTYGIDFAINTVKKVNRILPELKILLGDIRYLPFRDNFFDGYWSIGVIEHFYGGFSDISKEMYRVIKPHGILFLVFPSMSYIRKMKANLKLYPIWEEQNKEDFYQFAHNADIVQKEFESLGFVLKEKKGIDAIKGAKDEIRFLKLFLHFIYDSQSIFLKALRIGFNFCFSSKFNHCTLLVLRKY